MLIPVLSLIARAKDATTITLKDSTGAYNVSTNPGGYGSPNRTSPPSKVGLKWRLWPDTAEYANIVIEDSGVIGNLVGSGAVLTAAGLALTDSVFPSGVHQIKYYVFDTFVGTVVNLIQDSKLVTLTSGGSPLSYNAAYKAVILLNGSDVLKSKIFMLDTSATWTSTTFYMTEAWPDASITGYHIQLATEADLKVLFTELAQACIVSTIGAYARRRRECDPEAVNTLMEMVAWKQAAEVKFDALDYDGAHDLLSYIDGTCRECNALICQTCS